MTPGFGAIAVQMENERRKHNFIPLYLQLLRELAKYVQFRQHNGRGAQGLDRTSHTQTHTQTQIQTQTHTDTDTHTLTHSLTHTLTHSHIHAGRASSRG